LCVAIVVVVVCGGVWCVRLWMCVRIETPERRKASRFFSLPPFRPMKI